MATPVSADPLLTAENLSLSRGYRTLFENLSFNVCAGDLLQIVGANGTGKTSLMRILAGLSRFGFEGRLECSVPLLYVAHQSSVKALLTPRENLCWHLSGEGHYSHGEIDAALARVGLQGYEDVLSHSLSAGQHRRVNLARLYLTEATLWLLDEPFTAIDRHGVEALESHVKAHCANGGAVVFVSHQPMQTSTGVRTLELKAGSST
ncbi:MAG: cytochrome c biogenesis heme-transporting ATPase CcmA [Pseudomonadota bacterium]